MQQNQNLHSVRALQNIHVDQEILLRPLHNSDSKRILEILNSDPHIRERVAVAAKIFTEEDVAHEVKKYLNDGGMIRYAILRNDVVIGLISLWRDDGFFDNVPKEDDYGFGYFLDPKERGKGLMTTIVKSVMETVEKSIKVRQFIAFCEDENHASIAVLNRLGFKRTDNTFLEPANNWTERKYEFTL